MGALFRAQEDGVRLAYQIRPTESHPVVSKCSLKTVRSKESRRPSRLLCRTFRGQNPKEQDRPLLPRSGGGIWSVESLARTHILFLSIPTVGPSSS